MVLRRGDFCEVDVVNLLCNVQEFHFGIIEKTEKGLPIPDWLADYHRWCEEIGLEKWPADFPDFCNTINGIRSRYKLHEVPTTAFMPYYYIILQSIRVAGDNNKFININKGIDYFAIEEQWKKVKEFIRREDV